MMTTNEVSTVLQPHGVDYLPPPDPKAVERPCSSVISRK